MYNQLFTISHLVLVPPPPPITHGVLMGTREAHETLVLHGGPWVLVLVLTLVLTVKYHLRVGEAQCIGIKCCLCIVQARWDFGDKRRDCN